MIRLRPELAEALLGVAFGGTPVPLTLGDKLVIAILVCRKYAQLDAANYLSELQHQLGHGAILQPGWLRGLPGSAPSLIWRS